MRELPKVDGYTVDERLREFRKLQLGHQDFIPFDSPEGRKLLDKFNCCREFCKKLDEWIADEEMATKEYERYSKMASDHNEKQIEIILGMLSMDEHKHGKALTSLAMLVCKNQE